MIDIDIAFTDLFLSVVIIPKRNFLTLIQRPCFFARNGLIFIWIILGSILALAYKSNLLSSLIPIRYESTIDTLQDLEQSGLPLLILNSTTALKLVASDPREDMKQVYKRSILFPLSPSEPWGVPGWVLKMYEEMIYYASNILKF